VYNPQLAGFFMDILEIYFILIQNLNLMQVQGMCPLLMVFDMNASLKFYCEILGFEIHQHSGQKDDIGWVWLK
jgi:hypothetical protein